MQQKQRRPAAPGISGVPRDARGYFDTGLLRGHKHTRARRLAAEAFRNKNESAHMKNRRTSAPPTPTCCMLSQAFMSPSQTFDWSQQASMGCLFTSWHQVNILHRVPSCWKSEQRMGAITSVKMVNNAQVCSNKKEV